MKENDQLGIHESFILPVEAAFWMGILSIALLAWYIPAPPPARIQIAFLTLAASIYILFTFHWFIPRFGIRPWMNYLGVTGAIAIITGYALILKPYGIQIEILFVAVIAGIGILAGRRISLWAAILSVVAEIAITTLQHDFSDGVRLTVVLQLLVLLIAGTMVSFLTGKLHEEVVRTDRRNRYLSLLFQSGTLAAKPDDLRSVLSQIARLMACELPVTTCRIYLLSPNGDQLLNYGDYPIRPLHGWDEDDSQGQPILPLPSFQKALESGQAQLLHRDGSEHLPEAEKAILFFDVIKTVCLIPLIAKQARLGVIAVGEARNLKREPFTKEKLDLLQALAKQISTLIHNAQLYQESARQAERLEVLNEVTKAIGSTIELESLLELIYEQLRKVLPADTYFVSLYEAEENILDMRILIDDGERFPPRRYPAGHGLSSWVLQNRQPLLLRNMSEESASQPVKGILLGKARRSESWLGTPILVGDQPLGLLAIASYTPKAFDESDVTLLSNIASQASVALDNARQHAAVKEQARRDSLTGVYNHGHLLIRLEEEVAHGQEQGTPVSLIMLDIDHFKKYNDTYGHVVGDQVLRLLADAIQAHVKKTDAVGRWGGEEFAVALAGATTDQAVGVAERIRNTLASLELFDKNGERLPNPTGSQGIATFPFHAQDAARLVDVADMALYRAKGMGRDQIMIADA